MCCGFSYDQVRLVRTREYEGERNQQMIKTMICVESKVSVMNKGTVERRNYLSRSKVD